jgi:hypothetical protein
MLEAAVVTKLAGVPAIVGPFKVSILPATAKEPEVKVRVPPTVAAPPRVLVPEPEIVRLL